MFIKSAILLYLSELRASGASDNTLDDYLNKLRKFCVYVNLNRFTDEHSHIENIDLNILFSYVDWLRTKNKNSITVQSYVRSLRAFLNWCFYCGYIEEDLCRRFKLPKARKHFIDVLTDTEVRRIYDCFPDSSNTIHLRNRVIISLMLDCGLRLDEVVTAQRSKLKLDERYLIVTGKGNKQRAVSFGSQTSRHIQAYLTQLPRADPLLLQQDGSSLSADTIKNLFRKLKKKTGIERLHPHLLRHTFATRFLENGGDIYSLKELLGHTTLKQVQAYLHLSQTRICKDFERFSPLDNIKKSPAI